MILGALVDAGLGLSELAAELQKLNLDEFRITSEKVTKHGISGTKVNVLAQEGHTHRNLASVLQIIDESDFSKATKEKAGLVFRRLAKAEAEVHGTSTDEVHFHEVGAVDAIVDVVGSVVALDLLGIEQVLGSILRFGRGNTKGSHGPMPIPVPAVVSLCKGLPSERTDIPFELVTPTGAAILTTLASSIGTPAILTTEHVGYGAGSRDLEQTPNLLRVEIGETNSPQNTESLILLETNIDDMTPEIYGFLLEELLTHGAKDAYLTPIIMKKGRPGIQLSVLTEPHLAGALSKMIIRETTTLGIRRSLVDRVAVTRTSSTVQTRYGSIRVKIAEIDGKSRVTPEYDDCARIAREKKVPILDVYRSVNTH
jgi:uncharacterized protein (TIGR00299 family) protein